MGHCAYSRDRSTDDPVVTKNRPSSSDRNGRMSASTCKTGASAVSLVTRSVVRKQSSQPCAIWCSLQASHGSSALCSIS